MLEISGISVFVVPSNGPSSGGCSGVLNQKYVQVITHNCNNYNYNRIFNKIIDRDWLSARLFVT